MARAVGAVMARSWRGSRRLVKSSAAAAVRGEKRCRRVPAARFRTPPIRFAAA